MEFVTEEGKQHDTDCSTLLLPALSIGNVGQLAVDLLISSKRAQRIGYLDDPNVLPCVGNDAFGPLPQGHLALPLEGGFSFPLLSSPTISHPINLINRNGLFMFTVYEITSNKLSLVQQRSPVVKGMMIQFARNLADFAVSTGIKHAVVLSSLDFGRWQKLDMSSGMPIHYLSSTNADGTDDLCEKLGWTRLQEYNPSQRRWNYLSALAEGSTSYEDSFPFDDDLEDNEDYYANLPFAALFSCFKARGLKVTCVLCYCSEGDNIPDSFNLAEAACNVLGLSPSDSYASEAGGWVTPLSWKSVYGPPPDMLMF